MARKKGEDEPCGSWMDTYGDMVTLLLTFFIMLFSMSSVQEEKWQLLLEAFTNNGAESTQVVVAPEGDGDQIAANQAPFEVGSNIDVENPMPEDLNQLYEYLKQYVQQNKMEASVSVSKSGDGNVFIRFEDSVFFNPDSSQLKPGSLPLLEFLGKCVKNVEDQVLTMMINGHTAEVQIENYPVSDWRLSGERAASVTIYFEEQIGVNPKILRPMGFGKQYPVDTNETPEGRANNRRVDMMIIGKESDLSSEDLLKSLLAGTFDDSKYPEVGGGEDIVIPPSTSSQGTEEESSGVTSEIPPASQSASSAAADVPYETVSPFDEN